MAINVVLSITLLLTLIAWTHSHRFSVYGSTNFEFYRLYGTYETGTVALFLSEANYGQTTIETKPLDQNEDPTAWNTIKGGYYAGFGGDPFSLILLIPFHLICFIVLILLWGANFRGIRRFTRRAEQNGDGKPDPAVS